MNGAGVVLRRCTMCDHKGSTLLPDGSFGISVSRKRVPRGPLRVCIQRVSLLSALIFKLHSKSRIGVRPVDRILNALRDIQEVNYTIDAGNEEARVIIAGSSSRRKFRTIFRATTFCKCLTSTLFTTVNVSHRFADNEERGNKIEHLFVSRQ